LKNIMAEIGLIKVLGHTHQIGKMLALFPPGNEVHFFFRSIILLLRENKKRKQKEKERKEGFARHFPSKKRKIVKEGFVQKRRYSIPLSRESDLCACKQN